MAATALALPAEVARGTVDGQTWSSGYRPEPHQARLHRSGKLNKMLIGGLGSGKTITGAHEAASLFTDNPHSDGIIGAPTYPMLRDAIIPIFEEWFHPDLWEFRKSESAILWKPTGRRAFLKTATDPGRTRGPNAGWAWIDEAAQILSRKFWEVIAGRVRDPKAKRRCILATTTPAGNNWLVRVFRQGDPAHHHVVRARTRDNPHLPVGYEAGLRALYGDEFARQELDAEIMDLRGLVWPLSRAVHGRLSVAQMRRACTWIGGGFDWGHTNPCSFVAGGTDPDGRWYIFASYYRTGMTHDEAAQEALKFQRKWGISEWYGEHEPALIMAMQRLGMRVNQANKSLGAGLQHVRSKIQVRRDTQPRIYVAYKGMDTWHRECDGYRWPQRDLEDPGAVVDEEPIAQAGDHGLDGTRYLVYSRDTRPVAEAGYVQHRSR